MFTGIVEDLGHVRAVELRSDGRRFWIESRVVTAELGIGDSVACCGCCLTVVAVDGPRFAVEAVPETLRLTTLGDWREGDPVNLERALRLEERLGGHLVQGHIDDTGTVTAVKAEGEGRRIAISLPGPLRRFVAHKGSLAVDGVSLTVAAVTAEGCEIAYIPHTLAVTTAGRYAPGVRVNLEVDLLARYMARLLEETDMTGRSA
jgi:riboflavin synthase